MQWFRLSIVLAVLTISVVLVGRTSGEMILYFSFNEGEGEEVSNELGSGNNGTVHDTKWVDGKYGKALQFNGQTSYVLVPSFSSLNMTTQFTVEAWVNPVQLPESTIFQKKEIGQADGAMEYSLISNGWGAYGQGLSGNIQGQFFNLAATLNTNIWQHVAIVYDPGSVICYVNGDKVGEASVPAEIENKDGDLLLGEHVSVNKTADTGDFLFNGIIDEFVIYNETLSQAEIRKDMTVISLAVSPKGKMAEIWAKVKRGIR